LTLTRGRTRAAYVCIEKSCGYRAEVPEDDGSQMGVPPEPAGGAPRSTEPVSIDRAGAKLVSIEAPRSAGPVSEPTAP